MGKLIILEGVDSCGKGTQSELIKKYFENNNLTYSFYHFPMYGHNQFSDMIARFLRGEFGKIDEVDPFFVATLYAMDRYKFLPVLKKDLDEKNVVLLDRYIYSNIAFQCAKANDIAASDELFHFISAFEFGFLKLPYPDLNLFLDVPMNAIRNRLENSRSGDDRTYLQGKKDIHEADLNFQSRVRDYYLKAMEGALNCKIISCVEKAVILPPNELFESYKKYLDHVLFDTSIK